MENKEIYNLIRDEEKLRQEMDKIEQEFTSSHPNIVIRKKNYIDSVMNDKGQRTSKKRIMNLSELDESVKMHHPNLQVDKDGVFEIVEIIEPQYIGRDGSKYPDFSEKYAEYLRLSETHNKICNAISRAKKLSINQAEYNVSIPEEYKDIIQQLPPVKKGIIEEYILILEAIKKEKELEKSDEAYSEYHNARQEQYHYFIIKPYVEILGFEGDPEQIIRNISTLTLSPEKMNQIRNIRKQPLLVQFKGEAALQRKSELESVLGIKISPNGPTYAFEDGDSVVTIKLEEQLKRELNSCNAKLSELAEQGKITDEQEENYYTLLSNIYDYYMSKSRGEQIPFRRYSNKEREEIIYNSLQTPSIWGPSGEDIFKDEFLQQTTRLQSEFNEMQDLQRGVSHR